MTATCPFCQIISGSQAYRIEESALWLAFLDISPQQPGHTLVIPKRHHADLLDTPPEQLAQLCSGVQQTMKHLYDRLKCDGVRLLQNNGKAAGQEIAHLHFHLIPRWINGSPIPKSTLASPENLRLIWERLRKR